MKPPIRYSLRSLMGAVAVAAVLARWPALLGVLAALSIILGGPVAGGLLAARRGPGRAILGGVIGGVAWYSTGCLCLAIAGAVLGDAPAALTFFFYLPVALASGAMVGATVGVCLSAALAVVEDHAARRDAKVAGTPAHHADAPR